MMAMTMTSSSSVKPVGRNGGRLKTKCAGQALCMDRFWLNHKGIAGLAKAIQKKFDAEALFVEDFPNCASVAQLVRAWDS